MSETRSMLTSRHVVMHVCGAITLASSAAFTIPAYAVTAVDCANLATAAAPTTTIVSTTFVAAAGTTPEHCAVAGHVDTEIDFVLRLPTQWNGKFLFAGLGGLDGLIPGPGAGLARGYAEIGTNTGHVSKDGTLYDGSWAYNNPERQINWAYRSTHVVAIAGKALTTAYYGSGPRFSYYSGCSGGGRHAMMSTQRYPEDFDGVVAGAPFFSPTGQVIAWNWSQQTLAAEPLPPAKLPLIARTVLGQCDAKDGVTDGVMSDPRRCDVSFKAVQCPAGADRSDCLTKRQIASLKNLYAGPSTSRGRQLFPGWEPGVEDLGWPRAIVNSVNGGPGELLQLIPDQFLTYFIFGPGYDPYSFDFDRDPRRLERAAALFDVRPDLSGFAEAGGKIISYHGWADPRLAPTLSLQFHDAVKRNLDRHGSKKRGDRHDRDDDRRIEIEDFYRLFMVPGMLHCSGGPGTSSFDALGALERWVEQGIAPDRIIASHLTNGVVDRTRPLCPYPQEAIYRGSGDINSAASFVCRKRSLRDSGFDFYD